MSEYLDITEKAKILRRKFKEKGWNARKISVTASRCGYGTDDLHIKVKDIDVPLLEVERIANEYESIRRDHFTGEILSGGNTYVFLSYAQEVKDAAIKKHREEAEKLYESSEANILVRKDGEKELWYHKNDGILHIMGCEDSMRNNKRVSSPEEVGIAIESFVKYGAFVM